MRNIKNLFQCSGLRFQIVVVEKEIIDADNGNTILGTDYWCGFYKHNYFS